MKSLLGLGVSLAILLPMTIAAQQESKRLAWPPSTPGGELVLDYTRRLLTCDSLECTLKVVRSQQELIYGMDFPQIPEMQVVHMRQSTDGGKTWTTSEVTVPVYKTPVRMILGGCFGADLPMSITTDGGDLRVVKVKAAKQVAASESERSRQ